jgi:adenosylhomocysteine nucleosidase
LVTRTRFKRGELSAGMVASARSWFGELDPLFGRGQLRQANRPRTHSEQPDRPVLAVTGLAAEARVAAGPGIMVVSSGGRTADFDARLQRAVALGVRAIISFGIAGGLTPRAPVGTALVARKVVTENGENYLSDPAWSHRLSAALGGAPLVDMVGVDHPVADPQRKRALHLNTGAVAVDMESHVAARVAQANGLPFAAFRVVSDSAERWLPHAAVVGMRPDGRFAYRALLSSLLRQPQQLPLLTSTALDAGIAFAALLRSRKAISGRLGFSDFGEFLLDMPREDIIGGSLPV